MLERVLGMARDLGYHKVVLATFPWNESGVTLYERVGFQRAGVYHEQDQLDGGWVDLLVMEKVFD